MSGAAVAVVDPLLVTGVAGVCVPVVVAEADAGAVAEVLVTVVVVVRAAGTLFPLRITVTRTESIAERFCAAASVENPTTSAKADTVTTATRMSSQS